MSEDSRPGLVVDGATGQLVADGEVADARCWEPHQQQRRWSATTAVLGVLRDSLPAGRRLSRAVDLGCGTGDLTVRIASATKSVRPSPATTRPGTRGQIQYESPGKWFAEWSSSPVLERMVGLVSQLLSTGRLTTVAGGL
jgi:hypothetical protein